MRSLYSVVVVVLLFISSTAYADDNPGARWLRKAKEPGISKMQRDVYEQLAKVHSAKLGVIVPGGVIWAPGQKGDPLTAIYNMGFEAVPVLAEALEDDTPTRTILPDRNLNKEGSRPWRVCEAAEMLIRRLTCSDFALHNSGNEYRIWQIAEHPELAAQFRELVQNWYSKNGKKTAEQRQIEQVQDSVLQNRLSAVEWLGKHKVVEARDALLKRVDTIFSEKPVNSSQDSELSACALALGQLGDTEALGHVLKICNHLAEPVRWPNQHANVSNLFKAYQGWALLGDKDAALTKLRELHADYSGKMDQSVRDEYNKRLGAAEKW